MALCVSILGLLLLEPGVLGVKDEWQLIIELSGFSTKAAEETGLLMSQTNTWPSLAPLANTEGSEGLKTAVFTERV